MLMAHFFSSKYCPNATLSHIMGCHVDLCSGLIIILNNKCRKNILWYIYIYIFVSIPYNNLSCKPFYR